MAGYPNSRLLRRGVTPEQALYAIYRYVGLNVALMESVEALMDVIDNDVTEGEEVGDDDDLLFLDALLRILEVQLQPFVMFESIVQRSGPRPAIYFLPPHLLT